MRFHPLPPAFVLGILLLIAAGVYLFLHRAPVHENPVLAEPFPHAFADSTDQSSCLACHRNVYDIREAAPVLYEGRKLFTTLGCINCHRMNSVARYEIRKIGPGLRHIETKISKSFVAHWILDPAAYRPSTLMPRVIGADDPDRQLQAAAITEYLFAHSAPADGAIIPPGMVGDADRGRLLFAGHALEDSAAAAAKLPVGLKAGLGCLGCHSDPAEGGRVFGPDLAAIGRDLTWDRDGASARQWLFAWLKDPRHYSDATLMPNLRLSDQEAMDLAAYLMQQRVRSADVAEFAPPAGTSESQLLEMGAKLINHYGCINCHEIAGPAANVATARKPVDLSDWGDKPLDQLDFSRLPADRHTRRDWLMQHLTDGHPPPGADNIDQPRMPLFHFPADQAEALTTFVLGNRHYAVDPKLAREAMNPEAISIARGRAFADLHNCVGCHTLDTDVPAIQRRFKPAWISTYAPPSLRGEGAKVMPEWLKAFLPNVQPLRPLVSVRMPTFAWNFEDLNALNQYFRAASRRESGDLRRWITADARGKLMDWARQHGQAAAADLDPKLNTQFELDHAYQDILFKARFTADLYDYPVPRATDVPEMTAADFALGERLMQTLQCLDCHLMNPATGTPPADAGRAKAPNLDLALSRLQRRWVRAWVQEPDIIQHGANMPPYFSGLNAGELHGRPQQLSLTADQPFGATVDAQTKLLLDLLYSASAQGYTTWPKRELNMLAQMQHKPAAQNNGQH